MNDVVPAQAFAGATMNALLPERDDGAAQAHGRHEETRGAQVFAGALQPVGLEVARDIDYRVTACAPRVLLQRDRGADERDVAGLLVGLVERVGLLVRGPFTDGLRHLQLRRFAEIELDLRVELFLVVLAFGERRVDRELQPVITRGRGYCDAERHERQETHYRLLHTSSLYVVG